MSAHHNAADTQEHRDDSDACCTLQSIPDLTTSMNLVVM